VKKLLLFSLFGILGFIILVPRNIEARNLVTISATVLESITYIENNGKIITETNLKTGYWEIADSNGIYIVAKI
jgi:hypothetical protein